MRLSVYGILFLFASVGFISNVHCSVEIDTSVEVKSIIDGVSFLSNTDTVFRLADVEPRCTDWDNSTSFITSKGLLSSIILGKIVYLDIDGKYTTDQFKSSDYIECVVYVDHNFSHYLNVNRAIVEHGLLLIDNSENDFNPDFWTRYIDKNAVPEFQSWIILSIYCSASIIFLVSRILLKNFKNKKSNMQARNFLYLKFMKLKLSVFRLMMV